MEKKEPGDEKGMSSGVEERGGRKAEREAQRRGREREGGGEAGRKGE